MFEDIDINEYLYYLFKYIIKDPNEINSYLI